MHLFCVFLSFGMPAWLSALALVAGTISLGNYFGLQRNTGYAGELADQQDYEASTYVNTQSVAIQFGCAVARDTASSLNSVSNTSSETLPCKAPAADSDPIIGIALRHAIMPVTGPASGGTSAVNYAQYASVPVLKRGVAFAVPVENVIAGDRVVSITAQNGALGGSSGDPGGQDTLPAAVVPATGSIVIAVLPTAADTVTIGGTAVTFETSGATGLQVNIGATVAATATALAALLSSSSDTNLVKFTYADDGAGTITLTAVTPGTAGNSLTLATSNSTAIKVSGATLAGGAAAVDTGRVLVPDAYWQQTGAANGQPLKLRINFRGV